MIPVEIKAIINAACQAPSGGNSQPWHFEFKNGVLTVFATPEKDHEILNFRNRGTWLAHGALIENIIVASHQNGYSAKIKIFPDVHKPMITASIKLEKENFNTDDPLYSAIFERATNRRAYERKSLGNFQKNAILSVADNYPTCRLVLVEDEAKIKTLADAASNAEVVMLGNEILHKLLFDELVWSRNEEKRRGGGLYVKTMELNFVQQNILKMLQRWPIMKWSKKIKFTESFVARGNAKNYAKVAAMGAILVEDNDSAFIEAGRLMERIWLTATSLGLSIHLLTGIPFLYQGIAHGERKIYSSEEVQCITGSYERLRIALGGHTGVIAMLFRIGTGRKPTEKSLKRMPQIAPTQQ